MLKIGDILREMKSFSVWRRQVKNWRVVSVRSLLTRFFQHLTMSYNNIYIRELGADPVQLGMVNSFSQFGATLFSLPLGWLQDRYSLRKIFLIGTGLSIIVTASYALATGWKMMIPAMFLSTVARQAGACIMICLVTLKKEDRTICRGICDGFFATPSLIAPTLAAIIITHFGGISVEGIRPIYILQLVADLILFLFLITQLTEIVREKIIKEKSSFVGDLREVFERGTALKRYIAFSMVSTFATSMIMPFRFPFAYEIKGAGPLIIGGMTTASLVIQSLGSIPLANIAGRVGRKRMVYILEPVYWVSILLLVFAPTPQFLILSSILQGFRMVASFTCLTPLMADLVPLDCLGRWRGIVGLFGGAFGGLVAIPAPIIGGIIWERLGSSYVFLIPMAIDILVRLPIFTTIPDKLRKS